MLINKPGAEFLYNGITYRVGDVIIGSDQSEYAGLIGSILEIRDGDDTHMLYSLLEQEEKTGKIEFPDV